MILKIKLPFLKRFHDYHFISYFAEDLKEVSGETVKFVELGFDPPSYIGLFYAGKRPSKIKIDKMLEKERIELDFLEI